MPSIIKVDRNNLSAILADGRYDPITREPIAVGDEVVVCAECKTVYLRDSWYSIGGACKAGFQREKCECRETLDFDDISSDASHYEAPSVRNTTASPSYTAFSWVLVFILIIVIAGGSILFTNELDNKNNDNKDLQFTIDSLQNNLTVLNVNELRKEQPFEDDANQRMDNKEDISEVFTANFSEFLSSESNDINFYYSDTRIDSLKKYISASMTELKELRKSKESLLKENVKLQNDIDQHIRDKKNLNATVTNLKNYEIQNNKLIDQLDKYKESIMNMHKVPVRIENIQFRSTNKYRDKVYINYGEHLRKNNIYYLLPRIIYNSNEDGNNEIYIKIIEPNGRTSRNPTISPERYTYSFDFNYKNGRNIQELTGWGNEEAGSYSSGKYEIEIWTQGVCIGYRSFYVSN